MPPCPLCQRRLRPDLRPAVQRMPRGHKDRALMSITDACGGGGAGATIGDDDRWERLAARFLRLLAQRDMIVWRQHRANGEKQLGPPVDHEEALAMARLKRVTKVRRE